MYEWIIIYEDEEALNEILKIGTVEYEPKFKKSKFIIMKTYLSKETILNIKGVLKCKELTLGTIWV